MECFFLRLLKLIFCNDGLDIYRIVRVIELFNDEDDYVRERMKKIVKGSAWFLLIAVPLILSAIAVFMKTALIWKILLFIPSFTLFIFFLRLWWRNITGE